MRCCSPASGGGVSLKSTVTSASSASAFSTPRRAIVQKSAELFVTNASVIVFAPSAWLAIRFFEGNTIFMAVMTMPAIAVIAGEVWLGIRLLGNRFEALDVSQEFDTIAV